MVEKIVPDNFVFTICACEGLPKYLKSKVLTTYFYLNHNKPGLFEGSFSLGVNLIPLPIAERTNLVSIKLYKIAKHPI